MKALAVIFTILRVASARPIEGQPIPDIHYRNNSTADHVLSNKFSARGIDLETVIQRLPHAEGDGSASGLELTGAAGAARAVRSAGDTIKGSPIVPPGDTVSAVLSGLYQSGLVQKPQIIGVALAGGIDPAVLTQELLITYRMTTTKSTALLTTSTTPVTMLTTLLTAHRPPSTTATMPTWTSTAPASTSTAPAAKPAIPATTPASQAPKPEATADQSPGQAIAAEESALAELRGLYVNIGFHRGTHPCDEKLRCLLEKPPSYWVREVKACIAKPGFYWAGADCLLVGPGRLSMAAGLT